jgi:hypothetical protein
VEKKIFFVSFNLQDLKDYLHEKGIAYNQDKHIYLHSINQLDGVDLNNIEICFTHRGYLNQIVAEPYFQDFLRRWEWIKNEA